MKPVASAASALATAMYGAAPAWSGAYVLPFLKSALNSSAKPEIKLTALKIVTAFAQTYPESLALKSSGWFILYQSS
jgi:hypothetical protein